VVFTQRDVLKVTSFPAETLGMAITDVPVGFLPLKAVHRPTWMAFAACRGEPVDVFFSNSTSRARELCAGCDVKVQCLRYALADSELRGWWAGTSERERRRLRRRLRVETTAS
jgi:WhiB family redox-sensing transcriptional regulator